MLAGNPHRKVIPGGKYAALAFEGTERGNRRGLGLVVARLAAEERPATRLARPFFEHYPVDGRYDPKTGRFTCNICVPVAPL